MSKDKYVLSMLSVALLLAGCAEQYSTDTHQGKDHGVVLQPVGSAHQQRNQYEDVVADAMHADGVLTLRQALALTMMNNPELKAFSLETRAAEARELQAGLWPNPEIGVEVDSAGGTGELSGFRAAVTTIQLSQLIELGDKSQKRRRIASLEKELAGFDYQSKRLEIFSEAAKAFIAVLEAQEKLQLSDELLRLSQEGFDTVEKRVNAGKDSPVEKARASIVLANMKISNRQGKRELEYARKHLASFWGQDKPLFERAAGDLDSLEELPNADTLLMLLEAHPEYARWDAQIRQSQAVVDLERAGAIGDITVGAGVQRFNETDDNAFVLGVSIPLPISDRNQGAKQEASHNLARTREEQKAAHLRLRNEFSRIYQELADSYDQSISLKTEVLPAATGMYDAASKAYREGKVDYLHFLDAQRTLFEAKAQYIDALASFHIAKTDVERSIGQGIDTLTDIPK